MKTNNKVKTAAAVVALAILMLSMLGCSAENPRCTKPFDTMMNGLINCDTEMYKNAFSGDYAKQLDLLFYCYGANTVGHTSFDSFLEAKLTELQAVLVANYGEDVTVKQSNCTVSDGEKEKLTEYYDYYDPTYKIPVDTIEEVKTVNAYITAKGSENSYYGYVTYTVFMIESVWYLHPNMMFYTV